MITKDDVLNFYKNEIATTIKVMRAVPEGQLDFTLHDRSNSVRNLFKTFIVETIINLSIIKGEISEGSMNKVPAFDTVADGVAAFETASHTFIAALEEAPEEDIAKTFSMWGMEGTRATLLFGMMSDMIHHRGQLSAYLRPAGGKVPMIYGPSADEGFAA